MDYMDLRLEPHDDDGDTATVTIVTDLRFTCRVTRVSRVTELLRFGEPLACPIWPAKWEMRSVTRTTRVTPAMVRNTDLEHHHATTTTTMTTVQICASCVTELLRHTHHKSYSCNGAKHRSEPIM